MAPDPIDLGGGGRGHGRARCLVHDHGLTTGECLHPLGREGRDGHDGIGPVDRSAHRQALAGHPVPGERPRRIEDGHVVHGGHPGPASTERQVHAQPVGEVGGTEPAGTGHRPADPVRLGQHQGGDPGRQFVATDRTHRRHQVGVDDRG